MHVEVRARRGEKKYYLAKSYREGGKARKIRVYLGANLSKRQVRQKALELQPELEEKASQRKRLASPLGAVLKPEEIESLGKLEGVSEVRVAHLTENEWKKFTQAFTFDTNAIEGSTVTVGEVAGILDKGKWPDKPKWEISETYGVARAIAFIRSTQDHLSLPLVLELHRLVFENSKEFAGKLRESGVEVVVADAAGRVVHRGAPSRQISRRLAQLCRWYSSNKKKLPAIVLAAVVHNEFENIHPFKDGNGRVGRLLLNNILLKHGLPPVNIELRNRKQYYASLQAFENENNLEPTIRLLLSEYRALRKMLEK